MIRQDAYRPPLAPMDKTVENDILKHTLPFMQLRVATAVEHAFFRSVINGDMPNRCSLSFV